MPPLSGPVPEAVSRAFETHLFQLPQARAGGPRFRTEATTGVWRVPVILVSFADTSVRYGRGAFERALFDTLHRTGTGSVYDYFQWTSSGRLKVVGTVVDSVRLSGTRAYYANSYWGLKDESYPQNSYGVLREALQSCRPDIDWSQFDRDGDGVVDMVWILHAGLGGESSGDSTRSNLWSFTSSGTSWRASNGRQVSTSAPRPGHPGEFMKIDRFSIVPERSAFHPDSMAEIGAFCHEFGHALGLPDLYDTRTLTAVANVGPGNWTLMSSGAYGTDGHSPHFPSHMGAWPLQFLGWDRTQRPTRDTTLALGPLGRDGSIVELWFQGESNPEHFLIENRQRESFDQRVPAEGLLIYHLNQAVIVAGLANNTVNAGLSPGLWVLEADADSDLVVGRNRGDANDPFPGALGLTSIDDDTRPSLRTFRSDVTNLAVQGIAGAGGDMSFSLRVRAPGWLPPEDWSGSGFAPVVSGSNRAAPISAVDPQGRAYVVSCETRAGRSQILLRSGDGTWDEPFQVSNSPTAALNPSLTLLPGGDLAVVWTDTREGRSNLFYRARIAGGWTAERPLLNLTGSCFSPAISCDRRGTVYLAFQYVGSQGTQIQFMRFSYFSPFGQPVPVTVPVPTERPGGPSIAVAADGVAHIVWSDQLASQQRYFFALFRPDSGVGGRVGLTPSSLYGQSGLSCVVDSAGYLHSVWMVNTPGGGEIHYQRRPRFGVFFPVETVIEAPGLPLQNPMLKLDSEGRLHLTFEESRGSVNQIRYRSWSAGRGWDAGSTEVSFTTDGTALRPVVLPGAGGNVSVAYSNYPDSRARWMVRRRQLGGTAARSAPASLQRPEPRPLELAPNPLTNGRSLAVRLGAPGRGGSPVVEFYDLAGRRIAALLLRPTWRGWDGELEATVTRSWASGMYFARVRGEPRDGARLMVLR